MTSLFAVLDFTDFAVIAVIAAVFAGGSLLTKGPDVNRLRLEAQVRELQRKLDALLKHQGIKLPSAPSGLSPEVELLAGQPNTKIAAIKLYREQNPGTGLREAKEKIEAFYNSQG